MPASKPPTLEDLGFGERSGYDISLSQESDEELTRVGPRTPCGDYLRRFWHPVALTAELGERPMKLRILGEDLVLFREAATDGRVGRIGLVHRRCPHRGASLEYGVCESHGIRCCYHGWIFGLNGDLLEAPGQPGAAIERLRSRVRLGAYPAFDYKGLIFAYLGPLHDVPRFPVFDSMRFDDMTLVPYRAPFRCNWLQVLDAILDPIHTSFLHSNIGRVQFSEGFGEVGHMDYFERGPWLLGSNTRRVGDNLWMRVNELVLPNFTQAGAAFAADGTEVRYYGRSSFTRWVVPVDDHRTVALAWACFGERGDPDEWNTSDGPALIEQGELFERSYAERQASPGDLEAVEGMGRITVHANEHLAPSDKGVALLRRRLREQLRLVASGGSPMRAADYFDDPIPTYGGDSVLSLPAGRFHDSERSLGALARKFVNSQFDADGLPEAERIAKVVERLKSIEANPPGSD